MASDNEASCCESDPNFAVICAFMEKFGATCGLASIDFLELQEMLENTQEVPQELVDLHIKLLRKSRKTVSNERWEKAVIKFCHTFCVQDAWEIERFGYKKARLSSKLRVLKELLEMQFDYNTRFKAEINKMSAEELRSQPLGKDKQGHAYWFQNDNNCQIRVYKEDPDEETWTLVAKDRDGLVALISELSNGDASIGDGIINEEDSNSLVEKPIIDTGQVDSSSSDSNKKSVDESDNSNESKKEENISEEEGEQEDEEEEEDQEEDDEDDKKRPREEDDLEPDSKRAKIDVGEAVEEPVMLVKGEGSGAENECDNPIVGEEIEEETMYIYGNGNGAECETGNEDGENKKTTASGSSDKNASDSDYVSINCAPPPPPLPLPPPSEVPTSPAVKSPYKLGTIIDTKTDNKFFNAATAGSRITTKKTSRWDVETIIAKDPPPPLEIEENTPKKMPMFFFGPGCMQFKATVAFGQKVPQSEDLDVQKTTEDQVSSSSVMEEEDNSYRIQSVQSSEEVGPASSEKGEEEEEEKTITSEEDRLQTPLDSKIEDKLEDTDVKQKETKVPDQVALNVDEAKIEVDEDKRESEEKMDVEEESAKELTENKIEKTRREENMEEVKKEEEENKEQVMEESKKEKTVTDNRKEETAEETVKEISKEKNLEETKQEDTEEVKKEETLERPIQNDIEVGNEDKIRQEEESGVIKEHLGEIIQEVVETARKEESLEETTQNDVEEVAKDETMEGTSHENEEEGNKEESLEERSQQDIEEIRKEESLEETKEKVVENLKKEECLEETKQENLAEAKQEETVQEIKFEECDKVRNNDSTEEFKPEIDSEELVNEENIEQAKKETKTEEEKIETIEEARKEEIDELSKDEEKEESALKSMTIDKNENISSEEPGKQKELEIQVDEKSKELEPPLSEVEKEIVAEIESCDYKPEKVHDIPQVTAALIEYEVKEKSEPQQIKESKETDLKNEDSTTNLSEEKLPVPVIEEECVKKHSYVLGEETEAKKNEESDAGLVEKLEEVKKIEESELPKEEICEKLEPCDNLKEEAIKIEETTKDNQFQLQLEEKINCLAAKDVDNKETVISSVEENEVKKEESDVKKEEEIDESPPVLEAMVDIKKKEEEETPKDLTNNNKSVRGRKNNVSSEQSKVIFTRRTTRSSKSDETKLPDEPQDLTVKEEKKIEHPRRGRSRSMKIEKEEVQEADSKKMKLSEESQEEIVETKPTRQTRNKLKERKSTEEEMVCAEVTAEASPEVVNVESGNNSDTGEVVDKDPLAVDETPSVDVKEEEKKKPMSLSSFSLDFHESPTPQPTPPLTRSGLRKRGRESPPNSEDVEEPTSGKRLKKAKRNIDVKLRKSIEEQKKQELISSDDDKQQQSEEASATPTVTPTPKNSRKRGGKHKKTKNEEETATVATVVVSSDAETETQKEGETQKETETPKEAETQKQTEPTQKKSKTVNKNKRLLSNLGINPEQVLEIGTETIVGVRQSRRIAQLKIKEEAERRKLEEEMAQEQQLHQKKKKSKKSEDKEFKVKRSKNDAADDDEEVQEEDSADSKKRKKKKKKKHKKLFDEFNPWRSSSDSSTTDDEEEEDEIGEEEDDEVLQYVSDHEFSPESDLEADGEAQPLKRARTARKESDVEEVDDCPCQKCGKSDHPEWILLCDKCDNGWHCSCLRPPLLVIPEGDWFCPPCQHVTLLKKLQEKLKDYDKKLSKKEIEDRRKQRLAYVGISLNSVLPTKEGEGVVKKRRPSSKEEDDEDGGEDYEAGDDEEAVDDEEEEEDEDDESEESEGSNSASGSESDEPIYQLRQRRQAHSYRFNDYDELINSAIQEEMEAVKGAGNQGRGKDISTIVNAAEEEERKKEITEENGEAAAEAAVDVPEPLPPVVPPNDRDKEAKPLYSDDEPIRGVPKKKIMGRKKHRKLNSLDISSEDDDEGSDEDFKGTSTESEDDFDEDLGSEDSDDLDSGRGGRKKNADPVRRSTRARTSRYDADFIDDGDSEDEDEAPRRKKKRSIWDDSESEESDRSWGRRKRKPPANRKKNTTNQLANIKKKKSKKKKKKNDDSDAEVYRKKKPKIKFGLDGEDEGPGRRTRGKKINYVDALGSDSDEDRVKRPPPRIESEEEYVANEDEELDEDEKVTDEEESGEENHQVSGVVKPPIPPASKVQIQSYADARFTQLLPEGVPTPKDIYPNNRVVPAEDDGEDEPNPIDQINRNVEMMDENEMEKMMEEEEYANKQLQMVAVQLEKEKRRKEREAAKKLESLMADSKKTKLLTPQPPPPVKAQFQFTGSIQEPIVGNVDSLIVNAENNDELSEPPGVSLPMFADLGGPENLEDPAAKKRRAGRSKKSLEEAVANLGSVRQQQEAAFMSKNLPTDLSTQQESNIEIAAPPQPFSQSQPTPSVITRMLQSKPGQPGYPVGTIRPKQFASMPEREDEVAPPSSSAPPPANHHTMSPTPAHHGQYMQAAPMRPQLSSPYRQLPPAMNHYPRVSAAPPPPHAIRGAQPLPSHLYHSHRPMDPSPSGGGAISMADHHNSPGRVVSPASSSPGGGNNGSASGKNDTPPPPYSRPPPVTRFPMINTTAGPPRHIPMVPPPQHLQHPRSNLSPYHPSLPPSYHYAQFGGQPLGAGEEAMPPTVYQNSPYSSEQFEGQVSHPSENSNNSKSFDEESGGEFGGLVSYFSSQREDDLES